MSTLQRTCIVIVLLSTIWALLCWFDHNIDYLYQDVLRSPKVHALLRVTASRGITINAQAIAVAETQVARVDPPSLVWLAVSFVTFLATLHVLLSDLIQSNGRRNRFYRPDRLSESNSS